MVSLGYTHLQVIQPHKYLALHELLQSLQVVVSMCIQPGCRQVKQSVSVDGATEDRARMDISVLPNNNHPEKFLQLDVGMLPATHGMFQVGAVMSSHRHWQNRVYSQREGRVTTESRSPPSPEGSPVVFVDRYLEKHITPVTLKSNIKRNPLYMAIDRPMDTEDNKKSNKPSWTVREYDTQTVHGNLADYLKEEEKTPKDLDFWLEDLYTPGFDSLLKKKEAELKRKRLCKILSSIVLSICALLIVIIVPVVVLQKKN